MKRKNTPLLLAASICVLSLLVMLFALARRHNIAPEQIEIFHEIVSGDSIDARPEVQRPLSEPAV